MPAFSDRRAESSPIYHTLASLVATEPKYYSRFGTEIYDYITKARPLLPALVNGVR